MYFPTVEHAFQAAKSWKLDDRVNIASAITPIKAKHLGRRVTLRPDWEEVKIGVMEELIRIKFEIPELRQALLNTDEEELIEGNHWNDRFWGVCKGTGKNHLGRILMKVRDDIRRSNNG